MRMRRRLPLAADVLAALAALGLLYYWALRVPFWNDFYSEAAPAVSGLLRGDVHSFLAASPPYGGSLVLRAPAMALGGALGGLAGAYRAGALLCMAAVATLALALAAQMRSAGMPAAWRWLAIVALIANPASTWALKYGHPEELLTAALCVGGVLLAGRGRVTLSGVLLGVAVASKQWGVLALPVALAVAPGRRVRLSLAAAGAAAVLLAPLVLAGLSHFVAANREIASAPYIFVPEQAWWPLGLYVLRPLGGLHSTIVGRSPDAFVAQASHPLIVTAAIVLGLAWWLRRRQLRAVDALLLLAAIGLLRCVLDPWNVIYYHLLFLFALGAWEVLARSRPPLLTLAATLVIWLGFRYVPGHASPDTRSLYYLVWTLPAIGAMVATSLRLRRPAMFGRRTRTQATPVLPSRLA
jgi:hypothetical protein